MLTMLLSALSYQPCSMCFQAFYQMMDMLPAKWARHHWVSCNARGMSGWDRGRQKCATIYWYLCILLPCINSKCKLVQNPFSKRYYNQSSNSQEGRTVYYLYLLSPGYVHWHHGWWEVEFQGFWRGAQHALAGFFCPPCCISHCLLEKGISSYIYIIIYRYIIYV